MLSLHYRAHEKGLPSNIASWLVREYFLSLPADNPSSAGGDAKQTKQKTLSEANKVKTPPRHFLKAIEFLGTF